MREKEKESRKDRKLTEPLVLSSVIEFVFRKGLVAHIN